MPQRLGDRVALGIAACGQQEAIGLELVARLQVNRKLGFLVAHCFHHCPRPDFDVGACCRLNQAVHNRLRCVGAGEHPSIGFGFEVHPLSGKPLDGVLGLKPGKGSAQGFAASGIVLDE